ncbi:MAG TPA: acetyltransferase [Opitutales bacterium]|jgi:sugar O-acyltransferase (sialic acid O-acetyltransferase NeuD family)|nr:acetyltransferase [Opitutales bacterium]
MQELLATKEAPRPLVIVGAGGHGLEVLWVAARMSLDPIFGSWNIQGFVDDRASLRGNTIEGLPVLGSVQEFLEAYRGRPLYFHCAVGSNIQRQRLSELFEQAGFQPATIVDPMTVVSPRALISPGTYVAPRCYIGPFAQIGRYALINVGASIGHHSVMGNFSQACPGVRVNGHCVVEKLAFLGSNSVIHPGKRVGENATVAAGSFVVRDARANTLVIGVPAVSVNHSPAFDNEVVADEVLPFAPAPATAPAQ